MGDRWVQRRAPLALFGALLLLSGHRVRAAEFYCDERSQECRPDPCSSCSLDVIYRSYTECQLSCFRAASDVPSPWSCVLPSEMGPCRDPVRRWHFDLKEGECRDFSYGGCLGNSNNFGSPAECRSVCEYRISEILPLLNVTLGTRGEEKRCLLPRPDGVCSQEAFGQPRFAYDPESGRCGSFEWNGCQEGGNVFASILACQIQCEGIRPVLPVYPPPLPARGAAKHEMAERHKAEMPADEDHDPCMLPPDPGTCGADSPRLFFDAALGVCRRFLFGGCGGNLNNFRSLDACYRTCNNATAAAAPAAAACLAPKQEGSCSSSVMRFYYDGATGRCRAFRYSGCDGSANNFLSLEACAATCRPLAPDAGPCLGEQTRWHYDPVIGRCRKFFYGGCEGNANNFADRADCAEACGRRAEPGRRDRQCRGPPKRQGSRRCFDSIQRYTYSEIDRYYYDPASGRCRRFIYGGCRGNANNFETMRECMSTCRDVSPTDGSGERPEVDCSAPPVDPRAPSCTARLRRFYYSVPAGRCVSLLYGGCGATDNNFATQSSCERSCPAGAVDQTEMCLAPSADPGNCLGRVDRFTYDSTTGECFQFDYTGCGGSDNNFASRRECLELCRGVTGEANQDVCLLPSDAGPCTGRVERYFYSAATGRCQQFSYGGCEGNGNNFETARECTSRCTGSKIEPGGAICRQRSLVGPCAGSFTRYYFDDTSKRCQQFIYSGCGGNLNNFETRSECERSCPATPGPGPGPGPTPSEELCRLPAEAGPCFAALPRFYYDPSRRACRDFTYGGCAGNANNFETLAACNARCGESSERPARCLAPPSGDGTCNEPRQARRVYFDARAGRCVARTSSDCPSENSFRLAADCREECVVPESARAPFEYGGCGGNANSFETLAACLGACRGLRLSNAGNLSNACMEPPVLDDFCEPQERPEMRWTFNAETLRCEDFESSGCEVGPNIYRSGRACERSCQRTVFFYAANRGVCLTLVDDGCLSGDNMYSTREVGLAFGRPLGRLRRWAFSTDTGRCERFFYTGCDGNANNFESRAECGEVENQPQLCRVEPEEDPNCRPGRRETKYYFSTAVGRCRSFVSVGCERGRNVFLTARECEEVCESRDTGGGERPQFCRAEPEAISNCRPGDRETKYYFSAADGRCRPFVSLGCERGRNMFFTMRECREACDASDTEGAGMCSLPSDPGPCTAFETRWYRDPASGTCETFQYGGCEGNSNNFLTRAECLERCQNDNRAENEICNQPPETNDRPCRDEVTRFFWDLASGACRSFRYSGCGATANNFRSLRD
ncbi:papilin-like, partial [Pollicipes pollicipes]|uniref:papilin-like n=1 Tax=Pollicipes pollicipes TaxID=41117 RepID=UPI001884A37B